MGRNRIIFALTHGSLFWVTGYGQHGCKLADSFVSPNYHSFLVRGVHAVAELIHPSKSCPPSCWVPPPESASQPGITPSIIDGDDYHWQDRSPPLGPSPFSGKEAGNFHRDGQELFTKSKDAVSARSAAKVVRLCEENRLKDAVDILENMDHEVIWSLGTETYSTLLLHCLKRQALTEGKRVHAHIRKAGLHSNFPLGVLLVRMYCACGKMGLAKEAFEKTRRFADDERKKNVFIWTVLIRGYVKVGHNAEALRVYREMINEGTIKPDKFVLVAALNSCTSMTNLRDVRQIHEEATRCGLESDPFLNNALIEMYGKCGSTKSAREIFDKMATHNVLSWNGLIAGYAQYGHGTQALAMFQQMQQDGFKPDRTTFVSILKACGQLSDLERGRQVHNLINESQFVADVHLVAVLVDMYVTCGSIQDAFSVFEGMPTKTLTLWTIMLKGAAKFGLHMETIKIFKQMQEDKRKATTDTAVCTLEACASLRSLEDGKTMHDLIIKSGCVVDVFIGNALIAMYCRCGCLKSAQQVFYRMHHKNIESWNTIIKGCVQNGQSKEGLKLYRHLLLDELKPDLETYIITLDACAAPEAGRRVYARAIKKGMGNQFSLVAAVVEMYIRCGSAPDAAQVLCGVSKPEDVSWLSLLTAESSRELSEDTINFLHEVDAENSKQAETPESKVKSAN